MFNLKLKKRSLIILASILGLLIIFQSLAFAQPTSAPPGGNIDANFNNANVEGKLGLGTSSPTERIVVGEDIGNVSLQETLVIGDTSPTGAPGITLGKSINDNARINWGNTDNSLALYTRTGGTNNPSQLVLAGNGTVGVGASAPFAKFQVGPTAFEPDDAFSIAHPNSIAISDDSTDSKPGLWIGKNLIYNSKIVFDSTTNNLEFMTSKGLLPPDTHDQQLVLAGNGNVGINAGSTITNQSLLVKRGDHSNSEMIRGEYNTNNYGLIGTVNTGLAGLGEQYGARTYAVGNGNGNNTYGIYSSVDPSGGSIGAEYYSGYFTTTDDNPFLGTYQGLYADLRSGDAIDIAEYILDTNDNLEAADVVIADSNNKESVIKSTIPYDTNTLGVISTKPHLTMGTELIRNPETGEEYENVNAAKLTLAGRIPIKVTNENGQIKPGDLLTTSSTPGYAMKWTPLDETTANNFEELKAIMSENTRRQNAIIGKALESLDSEEGTIIGLLSL